MPVNTSSINFGEAHTKLILPAYFNLRFPLVEVVIIHKL